jgi:hypothetical protein
MMPGFALAITIHMTPRIRTPLLARTPLVATFALAAMLALSTPALARPTTECDERPQGCHGMAPEDRAGSEPGLRDKKEVQHRKEHRPKDLDDEGGADIGGL